MLIKFTIRGKPTAQARHRTYNLKTKTGKQFTVQKDPHDKAKQDFLALAYENAPDRPLQGPLMVMMKCVFPRPKSHYRTGRFAHVLKEDAPLFCPSKHNDFDNLAKFVCDALNHIFYEDDGQIVFGAPLKMYGNVPRTEFLLATIDESDWTNIDSTWPINLFVRKLVGNIGLDD